MRTRKIISDGKYSWKEFSQNSILSSMHIHLCCAYRSKLNSSWKILQTRDSRARLYYVHSGSGKITHHNYTFTLSPGNLYLIPANTLHGHSCNHTLDISWCHFTAVFHTGVNLFNIFQPEYELPAKNKNTTKRLFNELTNDFKDDSPSLIILRTGILLQLISPFFSSININAFEKHNQQAERFQSVLRIIENNLNNPPTVPQLSQSAGMSTAYFSRLFTKTFRLPPMQYILHRRIENSQLQLLQSENTIESIGIDNGFFNGFHFSKTFKKIVGLPPGRYRSLCRDP